MSQDLYKLRGEFDLKRMFFDILEAIVFLITLSFAFRILIYFRINFNYIYVAIGFLTAWVAAKMILRRFLGKVDEI